MMDYHPIFKVKARDSGKVYIVYSLDHRNIGAFHEETLFLVFSDDRFRWVSSDYFVEHVEEINKERLHENILGEWTGLVS